MQSIPGVLNAATTIHIPLIGDALGEADERHAERLQIIEQCDQVSEIASESIDCVTTTSVNTAAGTTAQVTGNFDTAVYCAKVGDIGNLVAPASFSVSIAYT